MPGPAPEVAGRAPGPTQPCPQGVTLWCPSWCFWASPDTHSHHRAAQSPGKATFAHHPTLPSAGNKWPGLYFQHGHFQTDGKVLPWHVEPHVSLVPPVCPDQLAPVTLLILQGASLR